MICKKCGKECEVIVTCTEKDKNEIASLQYKTKCCNSYGIDFGINETLDLKAQDKNIVPMSDMSLRDYFAAKAMQSYILTISDKNSDDYEIEKELGEEDDEPATTHIAEWAYIVADAMLKARMK